MHTVEMLDQAIDLASRLGYAIRRECLAGCGGASCGCELKGQKLLFLDLDFGPHEQLEQVIGVLRHEPDAVGLPMPRELRELLTVRNVA